MARALLLVPPLVKYSAGPLLGPALLAGAARAGGHDASVLDLNIRWIGPAPTAARPGANVSRWTGDHDKAVPWLGARERAWLAHVAGALDPSPHPSLGEDPLRTLTFSFEEVARAAAALARGPVGGWIDGHLASRERPGLVGVSVLYSGQVLGALVATFRARARWPGVPVVWGGPHVSALAAGIAADRRYGAAGVDGFAAGYAERTFVRVLDAIERGDPLPADVIRAGGGAAPRAAAGDGDVVPVFEELARYGTPRLTLPAQAARGCVYGRCAFCTYPAIEGSVRVLGDGPLRATFAAARDRAAAVSFKDSLVFPGTFARILGIADGTVPWSACTKLSRRYDAAFFARLAAAGADTLEIGLETLEPGAQRMIGKAQSRALFEATLDHAAAAGVGLIVNYITGFPHADADAERRERASVEAAIERRPALRARVEHNRFQLERLSPMGRAPERYGLRVTASWPWASVLAWAPIARPLSVVG